jgi:ABC-type lipoprotein release transport system permease subunit
VAILLVAAAVAGCLVPAQRAMRVDPTVAFRDA